MPENKTTGVNTIDYPPTGVMNPATLVIGAGIAGIQASLEIADAGHQVFLVERTGTIGGYMATFDKTFPTLDCAACILTPKMVEVVQNQKIKLMTRSEVKSISGSPGNFTVKILKKARYVNLSTCIGCGICSEKCPVRTPSEFDSQTSVRKAIYIPFPQAVPNKYLIDPEHCTTLIGKKCGVCAKVCPVPNCINYQEKDVETEITVGNIILATGYKPFDARRDSRFGYGTFPNVVTSLEFERLVNAAGPTGGAIVERSQDKKGNWVFQPGSPAPARVAIIHCVGSRDENFNRYCSKVCCMYSLKLAHLVVEKLPQAQVFEYYIDIRAAGKGYEEFYNRIKHEGVKIIRGRTAKIEQKDGKLWLRGEDILAGRLLEQTVDMAVLAVGLEPQEDARELATMAGITQSADGWYQEADYQLDPTGTVRDGILIAGVCQGPKDIPDTVAHASAAASRVLQKIMRTALV
jgi:heterodisulfide reductase subunit A